MKSVDELIYLRNGGEGKGRGKWLNKGFFFKDPLVIELFGEI